LVGYRKAHLKPLAAAAAAAQGPVEAAVADLLIRLQALEAPRLFLFLRTVRP